MKYAGIGSRETPPGVLTLMQAWATHLEEKNILLRSGGAKGADTAFSNGVTSPGMKQIFTADCVTYDLVNHAAKFHPAWSKCSSYVKALHARNSAIMLGLELNDPVDFVVCWTKNGEAVGGTGQALRIAKHLKIPVFNLHIETGHRQLSWFSDQCR